MGIGGGAEEVGGGIWAPVKEGWGRNAGNKPESVFWTILGIGGGGVATGREITTVVAKSCRFTSGNRS
jgi:hypothetical protein